MLQPGDKVWYGAKAVTDVYSDGAVDIESWDDNEIHTFDEYLIPDVPNLAHIARFIAEHPETVDALGPAIDHLKGMIPEYEKWEVSAIEQPADVLSQEGRDLMSKWVVDAKSQFALLSGLAAAMRGEGGHE